MLNGISPRHELKALSRRRARPDIWLTVKPELLEERLSQGWEIRRRNRRSISLKRPKDRDDLLRSRVWTLLYRMGFTHLSGDGGASILSKRGEPQESDHIEIVAIDDEVAVAVECRSFGDRHKDHRLPDRLAEISSLRGKFARAVAKGIPEGGSSSRNIATIMFVENLDRRDSDLQAADKGSVPLFDLQDLEYYEDLVRHLGIAARYQFLSEVLKGKRVKGLTLTIPALRSRAGKLTSYTFSVRPDYLLKIAYIAHRAKGKPFDVDAYQRMISKSRLKAIREFISDDGVFPTNIVLNIEEPRHIRFDQTSQLGDDGGPTLGWLTLAPVYGAAWVIDGQHRLFGYSGHPRASTSYLNVLAFEGLSASRQTELFVEINSEQRRVKRSLLVELDATLKWDDEDEDKRIHAVISKAGMALDNIPESPLKDRVLLADVRRTKRRCISLTALAGALRRPGFFIVSRRVGQATQYGPLWRDHPSDSLRRTVRVLVAWLGQVASQVPDWWELGSEEGGGLAMNDGVTVCIEILRTVFDHLNEKGNLVLLDDEDLVRRVSPYGEALGEHFAHMSFDERAAFRRLRGVQGQTTGKMMALETLSREFSKFNPEGLADWIERRKVNTNERARQIIDRIERAIQGGILEELKAEFQADDDDWWFSGVPKAVRKKIDDRINDMGGGRREENFDLLHYEAIIHFQWQLFKPLFAYSDRQNVGKQKGTAWLRQIGDMRNKVMHPSRNDFLSLTELQELESYEEWLAGQLKEGD